MKFLHISDLHIGKRVSGVDFMDMQKDALEKVVQTAVDESVDGVLVAGDVYDTGTPSQEAVELLDEFLTALHERRIPVFIISGNHDSATRLDFASTILDREGVHIAAVYDGTVPYVDMTKEGETVRIHMMPFVRTVHVRRALDADVHDLNTAFECALNQVQLLDSGKNILMAHQFVSGGTVSQSNTANVGTVDEVSADLFEPFDCVALGHLHRAQSIGKDTVRYCGTLLKYSESEADNEKSMTIIETDGPEVTVSELPFTPLHEVRKYTGGYDELMSREYRSAVDADDYCYIDLTDDKEVPDAFDNLRKAYPNLLNMRYTKIRPAGLMADADVAEIKSRSPEELFADFYRKVNGMDIEAEMLKVLKDAWDVLEGEDAA